MNQTKNDFKKENPLPCKETVFSNSNIPQKEYSASVREHREIVSKLRKKLKQGHARIHGHHCVGDWYNDIGPAYPLLLVILCICDWDTGRVRTYVWALAEVIGVSEKCIYLWLKRLQKINGLEVKRLRYGIAIYLHNRLIPNKEKNKRSDVTQKQGYAQS